MFKKDLYTEIVRVLNLDSVVFKGGYLIGVYENIPYVVDQTTTSKFDYTRVKVIPVSEELSQETPSVNLADRSDYIFQYKIMFQSSREDEVLTALDAFRTYFFTNKQLTVDGYTVSIKTSRGDKQGNLLVQSGDFYSFYTIKVFATAIKDGYIKKDADKWEIKLKLITAGSFIVDSYYQIVTVGSTDYTLIGGVNVVGSIFKATGIGSGTGTAVMTQSSIASPTTYLTLKLDDDIFTTVGETTYSNKDGNSKGIVSSTTAGNKLRIFYNSGILEVVILNWIMNKLDKNTLFDLKHTFDDKVFSYTGVINSGVRVLKDNAIVILDINWMEADL